MDKLEQLRKDINTVMEWRKSGKPLTQEQNYLANKLADEMIAMRTSKQTGVQIVSKAHIDFIKGQQPVQGSDAVGGIVQDVVSNRSKTSGKFPRKTEEEDTSVAKVAKPSGVKPKEVPISGAESGKLPRKTPDAANIKLSPPDNQVEGEVTSVADSKTDPKETSTDSKEPVEIKEIGHNPNLPMPKDMAEDLINNAKWGVEIGAYATIGEGMDRQLGRDSYAEFTDTPEKLKAVVAYLKSLIEETKPVPVA